jgi:flavin-dependent dehydrogenase
MHAATSSDVLIVGGGLAGLTLALQLRGRCPQRSIRVLERRAGPAPPAAFKVGESTVEIGAHYLANVLGLREHLDSEQVRKFGFRFFFSDGCARLDQVPELGISRVLPTPSWQLERGSFENFLAARARDGGISVEQGVTVRSIEPGRHGAVHTVRTSDGEQRARWLVDATGRAGLLRRTLGLGEGNGHHIGAAWFRVDARLGLDDWWDNAAWRGLCSPQERWRSTNHLCGPGYWVWLIPLASGAHSVGIVADTAEHPVESFDTFERALAWLRIHQPALAERLDDRRDEPLDFRFLREVSYGCRRMFSADRWALTGEAGLFLDPFYSPGTDFIAIANSYITALIERDFTGEAIVQSARRCEQTFFSFYRNMLNLYRGQYELFADARVMTAKVLWDYAYYWGILCPLVIGGRLDDFALFADLSTELSATESLNLRMQEFFRAWHRAGPARSVPQWMDQRELAWFAQLNARLGEQLDDRMIRGRLRGNVELLHALAATLAADARRGSPGLDIAGIPVAAHEPLALFQAAA